MSRLIDSIRSATSEGVEKIQNTLQDKNEKLRNLQSENVDYPQSEERSAPTKQQIMKDNTQELIDQGTDPCACPECGEGIRDLRVTLTESNIKESTYYASVSAGFGGETTSGSETTKGIEKATGIEEATPTCENEDCVRHVSYSERIDYVLERADFVETEKIGLEESQAADEETSETADEKQHQQQPQASNDNQKRQEQMKGMEQDIGNDTQKDKNISR